MAKRTAKKKAQAEAKSQRSRAVAPSARAYEPPIIPIEDIHAASNELRHEHPKVSDSEAEFVHLLLQTGKPTSEVANLAGVGKNWAYYHMSMAHVADYRQAVAIRVLGWDSSQALATMRQLLSSRSDYIKLEAARDIMDRAGLSLEPEKRRSSAVVINFNLDADAGKEAPQAIEAEIVQMGPVEEQAQQAPPFKNEGAVGGRGEPHTSQAENGQSPRFRIVGKAQ